METSSESPVHPLAGKRALYGVTKSNGGGAQTYVQMLAKSAKAAGAEVIVMAGSADGSDGAPGLLFKELEEAGIRTIQLNAIRRNVRGSKERDAYKEILEVIKREKPDVLHLNSSKMGLLGSIAGRVAGVPHVIFTAHGWPSMEPRSLSWKLIAWIGSWLTIVFSHTIICVSENDLRRSPTLFFRDKLKLIHNGMSEFPLIPRNEAKEKLIARMPDLAKYSRWLVMNAELHPNKGIVTAIRALAELAPRHPDLALLVSGEGEDRQNLTDLAIALDVEDRVFLPGFVPKSREYLLASDIYLLPSRKEGLPLALLEAGLAALPVVASKIGGVPEVITEKETGLFMPRANTHILATSIAYLIHNPEKAAELGANLRTKILTEFSAEKMVSETFAEYTK